MTVSASIPVAVISIALFRLVSKMGLRNATILENNIVQTAGSAGESIAFGVGVTMPAIMILGFDLELTRVMLVAVLGGLLGILMMIPLRRALIVAQHGYLKYPEGTACAEVLKAGASDESRAAASHEAKAEMAARDTGLRQRRRQNDLHWFRHRHSLPGCCTGLFTPGRKHRKRSSGAPYDKGSVGVEVNPALPGRRLRHWSPHRFDHVRGRCTGLPRADSRDCLFRRWRDDWRHPARDGTDSRHEPERTYAATTFFTSAREQSRPAASSACSDRFRRSGTA